MRALAPLLFALGCGESASPGEAWWEQREPQGACWQVNLGDGLDTEGADELHALYDCVNQRGGFDAIGGMDRAMDASSREDRPLGAEVGLLAKGLAGSGLDLFATAEVALSLMEGEDRPIEPALHVMVELLYGQPYAVIAGGGVTLESETALEQGVVLPLLPVVSQVSSAILDDGGDIPAMAAAALESEALDDAVCTVVGLARSEDDDVTRLRERLLPDLGAAIEATRDAGNDRWDEASGDSIRDLLRAALLETRGDGRNAIAALAGDLEPILESEEVRDRLRDLLQDLDREGQLDELPLWALHLAEVDVEGQTLCDADTTSGCSGGDSALTALVRLLAETNAEVSCVYGIYEGNLAIDLLKQLSALDPDTVIDLNELLGDVLGYSITDDLLEWALGSCDGISDVGQIVDDLGSLDRLNDPESGKLLGVLIGALGALYDEDAGLDELGPLADLLTIVDGRELMPPVEEVLRDLASTALMSDVAALVPLLLDPSPLRVDGCPQGSSPLDFDSGLDLVAGLLLQGDRDEAPLETLQPLLNASLSHDGTWDAIGNLGALLSEDDAELQGALELVDALVAADPELGLLRQLGPLLEDEDVIGPALRLAESGELMDATGSTELSRGGPLPFLAGLVTGGTLTVVLRTLDLVLATLGA